MERHSSEGRCQGCMRTADNNRRSPHPPPGPPPQDQSDRSEKNKIYRWEILLGHFSFTQIFGAQTPPPFLSLLMHPWLMQGVRKTIRLLSVKTVVCGGARGGSERAAGPRIWPKEGGAALEGGRQLQVRAAPASPCIHGRSDGVGGG